MFRNKALLLYISLLMALIMPIFALPTRAQAEDCTGDLVLYHNPGGNGPPTAYRQDATIVFTSDDYIYIHYSTENCASPIGTTSFKVGVTYQGNYEEIKSAYVGEDGETQLDDPVDGGVYTYSLKVWGVGRGDLVNKQFTITYKKSANDPESTNDNGTPDDNYPVKGTVCKVSDTSVTIYWYTKNKTRSRLDYQVNDANDTNPPIVKKGTQLLNIHSFTLSGLKKDSEYVYTVYADDKDGKQLAQSDPATFTPGEVGDNANCADYAKGQVPVANPNNSNANNINPGIPNSQINTGTSANFDVDLDSILGTFDSPTTAKSLPEIVARLVKILFILTGLAAIIVIILAGFRMVTSSGNEAALTKAKAAITWAIIGLIVSILAFSIVAIIQRIIQS